MENAILRRFKLGLKNGSLKILNLLKAKFEILNAKLALSDPKNILKKGYSLTLNNEGKVIRHSNELLLGQKIKTRFYDSSIDSIVS